MYAICKSSNNTLIVQSRLLIHIMNLCNSGRAMTKSAIHINICCYVDNYQIVHTELVVVLYQEQVVESILPMKSKTPPSHKVLPRKEVLFRNLE